MRSTANFPEIPKSKKLPSYDPSQCEPQEFHHDEDKLYGLSKSDLDMPFDDTIHYPKGILQDRPPREHRMLLDFERDYNIRDRPRFHHHDNHIGMLDEDREMLELMRRGDFMGSREMNPPNEMLQMVPLIMRQLEESVRRNNEDANKIQKLETELKIAETKIMKLEYEKNEEIQKRLQLEKAKEIGPPLENYLEKYDLETELKKAYSHKDYLDYQIVLSFIDQVKKDNTKSKKDKEFFLNRLKSEVTDEVLKSMQTENIKEISSEMDNSKKYSGLNQFMPNVQQFAQFPQFPYSYPGMIDMPQMMAFNTPNPQMHKIKTVLTPTKSEKPKNPKPASYFSYPQAQKSAPAAMTSLQKPEIKKVTEQKVHENPKKTMFKDIAHNMKADENYYRKMLEIFKNTNPLLYNGILEDPKRFYELAEGGQLDEPEPEPVQKPNEIPQISPPSEIIVPNSSPGPSPPKLSPDKNQEKTLEEEETDIKQVFLLKEITNKRLWKLRRQIEVWWILCIICVGKIYSSRLINYTKNNNQLLNKNNQISKHLIN